jgi:hypothetical protein
MPVGVGFEPCGASGAAAVGRTRTVAVPDFMHGLAAQLRRSYARRERSVKRNGAAAAKAARCAMFSADSRPMTKRKSETRIFKVIFTNQGQVFEVYAGSVGQGEMFGFVEVEQLLFGERSQLIVDSSEERLKTEFAGVKRVFIPLHSVIRIDEVEKRGSARITPAEGGSSVVKAFPVPAAPGGKGSGSL